MSGMDPDDYHWEPPTESEMKIIRAKRERSDKISSLMGSYMLKGYKMLGTSCELCGTILLRDKQQNDYCVACNELDTEHAKDNPVLSSEAAKVQAREYSMQSSTQSTERSSGPYEVLQNPQQEDVAHRAAPANMNPVRPQLASGQAAASTVESKSLIDDSIDAVTSKLAWANDELVKSSSCETCTQFCVLIKACAEALKALEHVAPKS
ncbi:protein ZNRD2-like isoform X2 [Saccoglossus kowalevskii]|uniref:Sjoegren syndrome/scleroderma autoantigen 1 homolog isoform 2 n=1 Tax=Saccoglossus kowalevskii TaxID=10224 RepID=A0ABM0GIP6_SACKO|nr:PREDICTED: Sjoegren syndrome/scleroderma autoantigen 1 homolog isoform 2 [Saccoglossus kowalevskii]